jgi:hypothetical protein
MQQRKITCLRRERGAVDFRNAEPLCSEGGIEFYVFVDNLILMPPFLPR